MNAYLLSLNPEANIADQWCAGFILDILKDLSIDIKQASSLKKELTAVVLIPASYHAELVDDINKELSKLNRVVLFLMGDEENVFPVDKISHENIEIWVQYPDPKKHDKYHKLGTGYPQHMKEHLSKEAPEKTVNIFFAGQMTHQRRREANDEILKYSYADTNVKLLTTRGFTQGESHSQYYQDMMSAKIAPCPSGAVTVDSFRLFEALECMSIPIADEKNPKGEVVHYWDWLFGYITPFSKITNWSSIHDIVPEILSDYPHNMHKITAWYIKWKREFKFKIREQLHV